MENTKSMNVVLAVVICIALVGALVFINMNKKMVFDSNVDPKFGHVEPFTFTLGAGQVIKGWDKGIVGMKIGEKKTLTIPPEDGYGATGIPGHIPGNATLTFDVELLSISNAGDRDVAQSGDTVSMNYTGYIK